MEVCILLCKCRTRSGNLRVRLDKSPVEVCKTKEALSFFDICGTVLGSDSVDLIRIHCNAFGTNNESKILDFGLMKFALVNVNLKACLT